MHSVRAFAIGLSALWLSQSAKSAEFHAVNAGGVDLIIVSGEIALGDDRKFIDLALTRPNASIGFDSPGGNLLAGIEIGRAIRLKGYSTMVTGRATCASACALAWLAGRPRYLAPGGRIGFHAAYRAGPDGVAVTSSGNAIVGAYLNQLGLSSAAIIYITAAAPNDMRWLTVDDARIHGLDVVTVTAPADKPADPPPSSVATKLEEPTSRMFSAQIAVRATEQEARAAWDQAQERFGSALENKPARLTSAKVNGRTVYRVRLGPMTKPEADAMCGRLKAKGGACFVAQN